MKFDKRITSICKGVAIILMVIHHIFSGMEGYGLKIFDVWVMPQLAVLGKVCVSIFLVLSGFGLYESCRDKEILLCSFYWKRFKSIYISYWLVFVIFVSIGYFVYKPSFLNFIASPYSPKCNLLLSFFGIQYFANGYMGFNPSWWFISQIILLYLLFPFMQKMMRSNWGTFTLAIVGLIFATVFTSLNVRGFFINLVYFVPFIIGMFLSKYHGFDFAYCYMRNQREAILSILTFFILSALRIRVGLNNLGILLDSLLAPFICALLYVLFAKNTTSNVGKVLAYLGKHSMNIYLIHLFITNMYTTPIIYGLNSPVFMVGITILISLAFSIFIEKIKSIGDSGVQNAK